MPPVEKNKIQLFKIETFSIAQLPELQGKKEEIKAIVDANPIVEIIDNETYEQAKKSRTAIRTLRTGIEKEQKDVKKKIKETILDAVDTEYENLVSGIKIEEILRQDSVTAYEDKKEKERQEKARIEKERIDNIKLELEKYSDEWKDAFNLMTFQTMENIGANFVESYTTFDATILQEFETLFPTKVEELTKILSDKIVLLTEAENARLEKLRLEEEAEALRFEKARLESLARIAAEAEARSKKEREDFEAEKLAFQKEVEKKAELERLEAEAKNAELEAKKLAEAKAAEKIEIPEILVPELPTVNVCNGLASVDNKYLEKVLYSEEWNEQESQRLPITTWDSIIEDFKNSGEKSYSTWLKNNYNVPTKIQ